MGDFHLLVLLLLSKVTIGVRFEDSPIDVSFTVYNTFSSCGLISVEVAEKLYSLLTIPGDVGGYLAGPLALEFRVAFTSSSPSHLMRILIFVFVLSLYQIISPLTGILPYQLLGCSCSA